MVNVIVIDEKELLELVEVCDYVEWVKDVVGYLGEEVVGCRLRVDCWIVMGSKLRDGMWRLVKEMRY